MGRDPSHGRAACRQFGGFVACSSEAGVVRRRVPEGAVERTRALADGGGQSFARVAAAPPARACARPRVRIACRGGACRAGVVPQTLRPAPSPGPALAPARVAPPRRQPLLRARWRYHFRRKRS